MIDGVGHSAGAGTECERCNPQQDARHGKEVSDPIDGALVRSLIGKDFTREFELSGKQLIVKSPDPKEHWRVAWEHY